MGIYIAWSLYQLYRLEAWIRTGARKHTAPGGGGIWASIIQYIYRNRSKERLRKRRLAEAVNRFNLTVSALPYATVSLSRHNEIEWSNPAALQLLGIDRQRDRGQRIDNLIRTPHFQQFIAEPINADTLLEITSPCNENMLLSLRRIAYGESQSLITAHDISQSAALQRMRKDFIANASHELRTPLTVILGYLESLESKSNLPKPVLTPIRQSYQQAQRMRVLIEDLLTLSSLETEDLFAQNNLETVAMPQLLAKIMDELRATEMLETSSITTTIEPGLQLLGATGEVESLCRNLIYNALRHTPDGTTIDLHWGKTADGAARLQVSDDGDGIEAIHLPHLTERFYRIDAARSRASGGTGLGLAIVKHIVQRHEALLNIHSTPTVGTQVEVIFPPHRIANAARVKPH